MFVRNNRIDVNETLVSISPQEHMGKLRGARHTNCNDGGGPVERRKDRRGKGCGVVAIARENARFYGLFDLEFGCPNVFRVGRIGNEPPVLTDVVLNSLGCRENLREELNRWERGRFPC